MKHQLHETNHTYFRKTKNNWRVVAAAMRKQDQVKFTSVTISQGTLEIVWLY